MSSILIAEDSPTQAVAICAAVAACRVCGRERPRMGQLALAAMEARRARPGAHRPEHAGDGRLGAGRGDSLAFSARPVVLMTAFGSEDVAIRALEAGAASYAPAGNLDRDLIETLRDARGVVQAARDRRGCRSFSRNTTCNLSPAPESVAGDADRRPLAGRDG